MRSQPPTDADVPILVPPPGEDAPPAAGWAGAPGATAPALKPEVARLLADLKGDLGNDPTAAAAALVAVPPETAAAALAALAREGRLETALVTMILAEMPPEAAAALLPHLEGMLPPEVREAVLSALTLPGEEVAAGGETAGPGETATAGAQRDGGGAEAGKGAAGPGETGGPAAAAEMPGEKAAAAAQAPGEKAAAAAEAPASAAEVRIALKQALAVAVEARLAGSGGDVAAAALGAALAGLGKLLRGDPADARIVVDDVFEPKAAYVEAKHEDRGPGGQAGEGAAEEALELMAAMRSLDFAGLKAVALDRAAARLAALRAAVEADPLAAPELDRAREATALLLASDPAGIARFGRTNPETFPKASARNIMGELLRAGAIETRRTLEAVFVHLLRAVEAGDASDKAHAAGYLAGAGAAAAAAIAASESGDAEPARRLAATIAAARELAAGLEPSPGGPAERDAALRLLDERAVELDHALAAADITASGGDPRRLSAQARGDLSAFFAARDPGGEAGLLDALESGLGAFGRS